MNKVINLALVGLISLSFCSCNNSSTQANSETTAETVEATTEETPSIEDERDDEHERFLSVVKQNARRQGYYWGSNLTPDSKRPAGIKSLAEDKEEKFKWDLSNQRNNWYSHGYDEWIDEGSALYKKTWEEAFSKGYSENQ